MADKFTPVFINGVKTPKGRLSYPHLDKPDTQGKFPTNRYKGDLLIPKDSDISALKEAVLKCAKETWPDVKSLKDIKTPFKDGDKKSEEAASGCIIITAKNKKRPLLVGPARGHIEVEDCYGGCYCRFAVTVYSYLGTKTVEVNGEEVTRKVRGVTLLLDAVQKIEDGDAFGARTDASIFDDGEVAEGDGDDMVLAAEEDGEEVNDLF